MIIINDILISQFIFLKKNPFFHLIISDIYQNISILEYIYISEYYKINIIILKKNAFLKFIIVHVKFNLSHDLSYMNLIKIPSIKICC